MVNEYKTNIITDKLALLNHEIRQMYIHELKQVIKSLEAESAAVHQKLLQVEIAYFKVMGEDPAGEIHGEIFNPKKREDLSGALLRKYGMDWCRKHRFARQEGVEVYRQRSVLSLHGSVLLGAVDILERATPAEEAG